MLNTIGESSKINTYSVSNEKVVAVNSATTENKAGIDDTAAILSLSEDTFAKVYTFLKNSMGLNKAQIAGVMGNMHAESGINADNANDNYYNQEHDPQYASVYSTTDDIAFGLIQWYSEERKRGLLDMAKEMSGNTNA